MIKRIRLSNWKTHKDTELEFGRGTNALIGKIGSGKTSVVNAISFALFGTTPEVQRRELAIDENIMSRPDQMNEASVSMEFDYKGEEYRIERIIDRKKATQAKLYRDNSLIAGPKPKDANERIEQVLEVNFELFSRAVYSEQNQIDYFLKLSAGQRKEKFDELLDLQKYENARANAVKVRNRLKEAADDKKNFLKKELEEFSETEIRDSEKKSGILAKEILELEEGAGKRETEVKKLREEAERLSVKKKAFDQLMKKKHSFEGTVSALRQETAGKKMGETAGIGKEKIAGKIMEKNSLMKKIAGKNDEIKELEKKIAVLEEKKRQYAKEADARKKMLPEKIRDAEGLEKEVKRIEKEILENAEKHLKTAKERNEAEKKLREKEQLIAAEKRALSELEGIMPHLRKTHAECPICRQGLEGKKRQEIIEEKSAEIKKTEKNIREIESAAEKEKNELRRIEKEAEGIEGKKGVLKERLAFAKSLEKEIKAFHEYCEKESAAEKEIEKTGKEKNEKSREIGTESAEKILAEIRELEQALKTAETIETLKGKERELESVEKEIRELGFNEEEERKKSGELAVSAEKSISIRKEITSKKQLLEETKKGIERMKKIESHIMELRKEIGKTSDAAEKLGIFINALQATQAELRARLIETINQAMDDVWEKLYPYRDYSSAKIEVMEGNYEVMVRTRNGKWINAEGNLSGGERAAVALTIRIAFSLVLAGNLGWIILDEPTHNLDEASISSLSSMLREHLPEIIEQIFLITHDKEMKKAASAGLYLLERDKNEEGITKAVQLQASLI